MYIKKMVYEHVGPIKNIQINMPLNENNTPKPVIIVGENGSGKSTVLSNIVDAFYEIAGKAYENARKHGDDSGHQYYKAIAPIEVMTGQTHMFSYITFKDNKEYSYISKCGNLSVADLKRKLDIEQTKENQWSESVNFKHTSFNKADVERIWDNNIICYFGPDRYEKPVWMGERYYISNDFEHPSVRVSWNGRLNTPIWIKDVVEANTQWLLDIIVDSRPDVSGNADHLSLSNISAEDFVELRKARENLETVLSKILGEDVYFSLALRNSGSRRLRIRRKNDNTVIAPSLDSLSTGQLALFNMFATIIRYADMNKLNQSINLSEISGIVVIDEVELHLHTKLQKEVLPKLFKLFPKVQFIITSHSPLFLLGMQEEFGEDGYEVYEMPTASKITVERFSEFQRAYEYFKETQAYQKDAEEAILKARPSSKAFVITEGSTDWKHMKTALAALKVNPQYTDMLDSLNIEFFEYEPKNSGGDPAKELEMGKDTLLTLCKNMAKIPQKIKYIFIADNDDPNTTKDMSAKDKSFKKWSNNVYSFVLPVPTSRHETPNICIEHLYTDTEIKTEVEENGILRRLYIGNEFDLRGLATNIDRICEKAKKCGPESIDIIEGSKGEKVTAISDSEGKTNYALPKTSFAKYVSENPDKFNFDNFAEIFRIIKAIIEDGETPCQNNQQQ